MSEGRAADSDWIQAWIDRQRERLKRLAEEASRAAFGPEEERGQERWSELFGRWQELWTSSTALGMQSWADLLGRVPALGPAREQIEGWKELAETQAQVRELEAALRARLMQVQVEALSRLEQRVRVARESDEGIASMRELYDLWVECGEEVYAGVAHSEEYAELLAQLGNATMRLRARQQKMLERLLEQFDLPTRSELNTVHRQIRELRATIEALQAKLAASGKESGR
ncbi:MAG TPA: poly(R)-hydroxyalkanoic acid synthase subunit PhaE [Steroidobacteraceae bacterium]